MRKKFLQLLSLLACGLLTIGLAACGNNSANSSLNINSSSQGIIYQLSNDGTYATVTHYVGTSTEIIISSTYQNVPVTSIEEKAFFRCKNITSVTIPNSVTSIGDRAFGGCKNLQYNEKDELKYLGNESNPYLYLAGTATPLITTAIIDEHCTIIASESFRDCSNLLHITIPNSVTTIETLVLSNCQNLQYNKKDELKYLGNDSNPYLYLVDTATKSITNATIDENCRFIGSQAFQDCNNLTNIFIPASVTYIGELAFRSCSKLTMIDVSINNATYTSIDGNLYSYNKTILIQYAIGKICSSFNTPNSVIAINNCAFLNCCNLTTLTIPDSVTTIGISAFNGCNNLTNIAIPDSITSIGSSAFSNCENLQYNKKNELNYLGSSTNPYLYLVKSIDSSIHTAIIDEACRFIGSYAFMNCSNLTNITIPNSVISIGNYAFYDCNNLTHITIPNNVISIGEAAFDICEKLSSVKIGNSVTFIGSRAFKDCNLINLAIPPSVTKIGSYAFDCDNLAEIKFEGTMEQWKTVSKGMDWTLIPATKVICKDGEVEL